MHKLCSEVTHLASFIGL